MKSIMSKGTILIMVLIMFISLFGSQTRASAAETQSGGLLAGKALDHGYGGGMNISRDKSTKATDGDISTYININFANPTASLNNSSIWYKFDTPVDLSGYKLNASDDVFISLNFTDRLPVLITSTNKIGEFVSFGETYKNVNMVSVSPKASNQNINVYEFDVFPTLTVPEAPLNLSAKASEGQINLSWNAVAETKGYNVKRSLTSGGPYTTIASSVVNTTYEDKDVQYGQTYYYVVTALNTDGESLNSNEVSATPLKVTKPEPEPSGDRAILTITLTTGLEKEFDLSNTEVKAFLEWYDARDAGTGPAKFAINKHDNNKGPFSKRTDYVLFDKVLTFSVDEYSAK